MLHNVVFHDNIYQLARNIDLVFDGIRLELDEELFAEKLFDDLLFCNMATQKIFERLHKQSHLNEYVDAMNCLYSCVVKFLRVLNEVIDTTSKNLEIFSVNNEKLKGIKAIHEDLRNQIALSIYEKGGTAETVNIVSEVELNQLLNF